MIFNNIIFALLGFSATGKAINDKIEQLIRVIRARLTGAAIVFFIAVIAGFIANVVGFRAINFAFHIFFVVLGGIIWSNPRYLIFVSEIGGIINTNDFLEGLKEALEKYSVVFFGNILLYGSLVFVVLATVPFDENPEAILGIASLAILSAIMATVWKMRPSITKKMVFSYVTICLLFYIFIIVPSTVWMRVTGYDLKGWFVLSSYEKALIETKRAAEKIPELEAEKRLKEIRDKLKKGRALIADDLNFLKKEEEKVRQKSLPEKIKNFSSAVFSTEEKKEFRVEKISNNSKKLYFQEEGHYKFFLKEEDDVLVEVKATCNFRLWPEKDSSFFVIPFEGKVEMYDKKEEKIILSEKDINIFRLKAKEDIVFFLDVFPK